MKGDVKFKFKESSAEQARGQEVYTKASGEMAPIGVRFTACPCGQAATKRHRQTCAKWKASRAR